MKIRHKFLIILALVFLASSMYGQRITEKLGRGVTVIYKGSSTAYISWRLLAADPSNISFNVYKSAGGAAAVKLNASPVTATTDYTDASLNIAVSNSYFIKPVVGGVEQPASTVFTIPANATAKKYISLPLQSLPGYHTLHVYVGDINGDGEYDYIVKRMPDDSLKNIVLDAYLNNGTYKWRVNLGPNIEQGNSSATSPVLVADFDSDGIAEICTKTSEGTVFSDGAKIGDINGDGKTDYRTFPRVSNMNYQVLGDNCPQLLSMIDGLTGKEITRTNFIPLGAKANWTSYWGDNYGHRMNFIMATVAYLDGVHPSIVMSRGPGDKMDIGAWDYSNHAFTNHYSGNSNWAPFWTSRGKAINWADFHAIRAVDLDGDGKDEVSWGINAMDDNGSPKYYAISGYGHGDRFQIGDFDPDRAGLEAYAIQQSNPNYNGAVLYDAKTGAVIKNFKTSSIFDVGRGDVADVDPNVKGMELYSHATSTLMDCRGNAISGSTAYPNPALAIWWDGDLLRENLDAAGSSGMNPIINKWNPANNTTSRLLTLYNEGGSYSSIITYGGRPALYGDIMGDWREEIVCEDAAGTELRIFSTTTPASTRIYCLAQNPEYRACLNQKGYIQSNYPDFYLGEGMATPPAPNITYAADIVTGGVYQVMAKHSGKVLRAEGNANGSCIQQWPYSAHYNYQWRLTQADFGYYTLKNEWALKYIDIANANTQYGTTVQLNGYTGLDNQLFKLQNAGDGYFNIVSKSTGKVFDISGISTADGALLQEYSLWGGDNQKFKFIMVRRYLAPQAPTALTEPELQKENVGFTLSVSPNPATANTLQLTASIPVRSEVRVSIVDFTGKEVANCNIGILDAGSTTKQIDISNLNQGIYIVVLHVDGYKKTCKLIRQ